MVNGVTQSVVGAQCQSIVMHSNQAATDTKRKRREKNTKNLFLKIIIIMMII